MFRRYLFRNYRLLSALQHWLKRRLTPSGILVLWTLFFVAGLGMDTDVTMAYQAFSFLVCLVFASAASAYFSRGRYEVRRILPKFGTVETALPTVFCQESHAPKTTWLGSPENLGPAANLDSVRRKSRARGRKAKLVRPNHAYYRWRWLCKGNIKADIAELPLPTMAAKAEVEVSII
jgi:hypothetical protein